jgi:hypothetical protein
MSVLSFPRIYFKGFLQWDPCTFNNNDWQEFQTYDGANAALNWSFLKKHGVTPDNFTTTFRPWAIKLQEDVKDKPPGPRVPAEWNMFGTHGVSFVQYGDFTTTVIGGDLEYGNPVQSVSTAIAAAAPDVWLIPIHSRSGPVRFISTSFRSVRVIASSPARRVCACILAGLT